MPTYDITLHCRIDAPDEDEALFKLDEVIDIAYEIDDCLEIGGPDDWRPR